MTLTISIFYVINLHPNDIKSYTKQDFDKTTSPFSFNAGNVYHSLEYQHYELLQICATFEADELLSRMIHATEQSVRKSGDGDAWFKASPHHLQYPRLNLVNILLWRNSGREQISYLNS